MGACSSKSKTNQIKIPTETCTEVNVKKPEKSGESQRTTEENKNHLQKSVDILKKINRK